MEVFRDRRKEVGTFKFFLYIDVLTGICYTGKRSLGRHQKMFKVKFNENAFPATQWNPLMGDTLGKN